MFRFLHLADLHLGWEPARLDPEEAALRRKRRDSLLERAVDFALESQIDLVVIAGDLFETHRPTQQLRQRVIAQLSRLTAAGIELLTTPGNHDEITYADSVYLEEQDTWPGVLVTNPLPEHVHTFHLGGHRVFVYSLAYTGGVTPAGRPLRDFPRVEEDGFHLGVFHGTVGSAGERSLPLDRRALQAAGYDYVALGHIHLPSITEMGRTKVVYSGCNEGKGFDDPGVPNWTVVSAGNGGCEIEKHPLEVQPIRTETFDLTECESSGEIDARIAALADGDAFMRVRLTGSLHFPLETDSLEARHGHLFHHFEVCDESDSIGEALLDAWAAERTVRGTFVRQMRKKLEQATTAAERTEAIRALKYGIRALRSAA